MNKLKPMADELDLLATASNCVIMVVASYAKILVSYLTQNDKNIFLNQTN